MAFKREKIDLSKFLSENLNVNLGASFRFELFTKAVKTKGTITELAKHLKVHPCSIRRWRNGITFPKLAFLRKVADIAGVAENVLYENIVSVTAKRKSNSVQFIRELRIDEEFAEWFGLLEGDGCIRKALYDVALSNEIPRVPSVFHARTSGAIWDPKTPILCESQGAEFCQG